MRNKSLALVAAGAGLTLVLTACGGNSSESSDTGSDSAASTEAEAGGDSEGATVGVILPDTKSSSRYENQDRPLLEKALGDAGLTPIIQNAEGDTTTFSTIADQMITQGATVIMMSNLSSESGAAVQKKADEAGVITIDYDRLTLGGSAQYYVSFDNTVVGELQGQGLVDCLADTTPADVIQLNGSPTDNNATLFKEGAVSKLQPKYDAGDYTLAGDQAVPDWDNQKGGQIFEQLLTANGGKVDGVLAANDGLAGAVITVLQKNKLNGTVPVTGQDATAAGLQAILRGDQCMTVFKDVNNEAKAAADLAIALANGDQAAADELATAEVEDTEGGRQVPSVLLEPETITKENVQDVIDSGSVTVEEVCADDVAELCTEAGIS